MAIIQLQFVCEAKITSRAIAWFSQGHFSHVDAVTPSGNLLGARHSGGVQVRSPGYLNFTNRVLMTVPCTDAQNLAFYSFLAAQVGKPYDAEAIWAFAFNRNWRETDSWICSELLAAAGESAGILPTLYLAANKITPVVCAVAFSAVGGKE